MSGENNLDILLADMRPELRHQPYVFLTSAKDFDEKIKSGAVMVFLEAEGVTIVVAEEIAQVLKIEYQNTWAMITLTIHSDLNAIGFLAAITKKLADAGISVNAVSAFYHDHLFVPWEKRDNAMNILRSFSK